MKKMHLEPSLRGGRSYFQLSLCKQVKALEVIRLDCPSDGFVLPWGDGKIFPSLQFVQTEE